MTIKTTVFSQDKRITNDAMRLVRGIFPNIGPAYSDKRRNGRRYKFVQWGTRKAITPAIVAEINKLFAEGNIRAKAYLHEGDGRSGYGFWDGHLCIRTYDESNIKSNNTNTTPIMKSKKNNPVELYDKFYAETKPNNITASDITAVIAAALEQHFSGKLTPASTNNEDSDEIFTFTGEELAVFVRKVAGNTASQCLDSVRDCVIDQDSNSMSIEILSKQLCIDVDMRGVADDLEETFDGIVDDVADNDDNIQRWYESVKK